MKVITEEVSNIDLKNEVGIVMIIRRTSLNHQLNHSDAHAVNWSSLSRFERRFQSIPQASIEKSFRISFHSTNSQMAFSVSRHLETQTSSTGKLLLFKTFQNNSRIWRCILS